jgi:hypothetical protein
MAASLEGLSSMELVRHELLDLIYQKIFKTRDIVDTVNILLLPLWLSSPYRTLASSYEVP